MSLHPPTFLPLPHLAQLSTPPQPKDPAALLPSQNHTPCRHTSHLLNPCVTSALIQAPQHPLLTQHPLFQRPSTPQPCPATTSAAPAVGDPPRWLTAATSPVSGSARTPRSSSSPPPWWSPCRDPSSAPSPRTPPSDPPHQLPWAAPSAPREWPSPPAASASEAWAASTAAEPATPAKGLRPHPHTKHLHPARRLTHSRGTSVPPMAQGLTSHDSSFHGMKQRRMEQLQTMLLGNMSAVTFFFLCSLNCALSTWRSPSGSFLSVSFPQ